MLTGRGQFYRTTIAKMRKLHKPINFIRIHPSTSSKDERERESQSLVLSSVYKARVTADNHSTSTKCYCTGQTPHSDTFCTRHHTHTDIVTYLLRSTHVQLGITALPLFTSSIQGSCKSQHNKSCTNLRTMSNTYQASTKQTRRRDNFGW